MANLYRKVDDLSYDNLVTGISPDTEVEVVTMLALGAPTTYLAGTLLGIHTAGEKAGKCVILGTAAGGGEVITPAYMLAEDTLVGLADVNAPAYRAGCFAPEHIIVADAYILTDLDYDVLRTRNIVFKSSFH
ncbi:MAG: hypothetical protein PHQ85_07090 [Eubacteriales bacterium]|nr:hypothetical protein [Eubacteriales bacterium]